MIQLLLFTSFILCVLCAPTPLPNKESFCGTTKVKLSETILDTNAIDDYQLSFVSDNRQLVFLRTTDGHIYRSSDEGKTWTKQTVPEIMPKIDTNPGGISRMFNFQATNDDRIILYFLGSSGQSFWATIDGGQTYTFSDSIPSDINWLYLSPMFPGLALARRLVGNTIEIWLCENVGKSWRKLVDNLPSHSQVSWSIFPNTVPNRIYLLRFADPSNPNPHNGVIVYSDDYFVSSVTLPVRQVLSWAIYQPNKFVVVTCDDVVTCVSKQLHISDDGGKTFNLAEIPENRKETPDESSFYVWEISDDAIWTYVDRSCTTDGFSCWGDLFHSNAADKDFVLSLQYNKRFEFTKFNSLDGIYLANQFVTKVGVPESGDSVRSLITFNKGSEWNILQAPSRDANGQQTKCLVEEGCSLHVHGYGSAHTFTYFYSIPKAIGLMIASGNLGKRLEHREDQTNTYVSFNGGVTWEEVRKNDYVPEIGDFGSTIVLVKEDGVTDEIVYTISEGDEWTNCKFTDQPFDVSNIRVSQNWESRKFILYGQRVVNGTTKAIIIQLDLEDEFTGKCTDSDFTNWSPTSEHSHCVMGAGTTYRKRIKGHKCYLGSDYNPIVSSQQCPCIADDYECDHCFYRQDLSSPCSLQCKVDTNIVPPASCNSTGYFEVDQGYRLVDNNKCNNTFPGSKKPKGLIPCSNIPTPNIPLPEISNGLSAIPIVIIIVVFVLIAVGTVWYLFKNNDSFYNFVSYTFGIEDSNRAPLRYTNVEQGQSLADNVDGSD